MFVSFPQGYFNFRENIFNGNHQGTGRPRSLISNVRKPTRDITENIFPQGFILFPQGFFYFRKFFFYFR